MKNELLKMLLTRFSDETLYAENGLALRYRLFTGKGENLPLVLFLHGMGERGHDNQAQILNNGGAHLWAAEEIQQKHPCHIVAPQCPDALSWAAPGMPELLVQLVDRLCARLKADPMRLYVCGLSMGGMGAWNLAGRYPGKFAAVMPVCGGASIACAAKIGRVPLRAYHAADDPVVPPTGEMRPPFPYGDAPLYGSRLAVSEATRSGDPFAEYIEYPAGMIGEKWGHPHASWEEAFRDPQAISWMFRQSRLDLYEISCPTPGVWEISDSLNDSFYVVTGRDRALVIDTGMARGDVPALVREITALPFDLALTHGHGDHSMHCARFDTVYLHRADREMLFSQRFEGQPLPEESALRFVEDGDVLDLGGGVKIECVALPGHTPGSLLLVDSFHKCVFTGDAVGSGCGVWMQVPTGSPLSEYAGAIRRALARLAQLGVNGESWRFLGGHAAQRFQSTVSGFNPIAPDLMEDMAILCDKLCAGEITGVTEHVDARAARFGDVRFACYGRAEILYRTEQVK